MSLSESKKKPLKRRSYKTKKGSKDRQGERTKKNNQVNQGNLKLKNEVKGIIAIAMGIFLAVTFHTDATGLLGEFISGFLKGCFSSVAIILPYYLMIYGVLAFLKKSKRISPLYALLLFIGILILYSLRYSADLKEYKMSADLISELYTRGQLIT